MESLPIRMKVWRATYGLTQARAADVIGCSLTTWSRWERGATEPQGYWYMDLDRLLDVAPSQWVDLAPRPSAAELNGYPF